MKAGKDFFLYFLCNFFPIGYKFLLKIINGDSVNHEKGYLPPDPEEVEIPL